MSRAKKILEKLSADKVGKAIGKYPRSAGAAFGGALGAGLGAGYYKLTGRDPQTGAIIHGLRGAALGGLSGHVTDMERKEADRRLQAGILSKKAGNVKSKSNSRKTK